MALISLKHCLRLPMGHPGQHCADEVIIRGTAIESPF
jgi:hypothetical protein